MAKKKERKWSYNFRCETCGYTFTGDKIRASMLKAMHKKRIGFNLYACPMEITKYGTLARPDLAEYINTLDWDLYMDKKGVIRHSSK